MNLFTELKPEWSSMPPERLLDAPATALKAVDAVRAESLREWLGVETLRELANHPVTDWVWRTFSLFRAGVQRELPEDAAAHVHEDWRARSCGEWLASPLSSLTELSDEAANGLGDTMGWVTVRHMASDGAFAAAREVHRIVTGGPLPPEDTATRPLPDYFAGSTQRFMAGKREAAGLPARPPPPPPAPPPAPAAAPAPEPPAEASWAKDGVAPAVAAGLAPHLQAGLPPTRRQHAKDYTADGTYIPKGGGTRGWMGNQGVARNERGNRYRYQEVVDFTRFRQAELEEQVRVNNRGAERKELRMQVRWAQASEAPPMPGLCLNVSITGARVRCGQQLPEGTPIYVTWVHRDEMSGQESAVLALAAKVVWSRTVDATYRRPRYDCGVHFDAMDLRAQEGLTMLLTDRVDELVAAATAPAGEAAEGSAQ